MPVDYGTEASLFHAPVMRIDDAGHGFVGVVYQADRRQAVDFDSRKLKWFDNRELVKSDSKPSPNAEPVWEYVFHVAARKAKGAFTKRDENGDPIVLSSGKTATEVRELDETDIAFVTSGAWLSKLIKSVRLNEGHEVRLKRITPARDENGDRMTKVDAEIEILGTVGNPRPYKRNDQPIYDDADPGF